MYSQMRQSQTQQNRYYEFGYVLAIFMFMLFGVNVSVAKNVLKNGDFEQSYRNKGGYPAFWKAENFSKGARMKWTTDAYSGKHAVKFILNPAAGQKYMKASIVSPTLNISGGVYEFTGWYKTDGDINAYVQYVLNGKKISRVLSPAKNWTKFKIFINVKDNYKVMAGYLKKDNNTLIIRLRCSSSGKAGSVYYDKVSLTQNTDIISLRIYPAEYQRNNTIFLLRDAPGFMRVMLIGDKKKITKPVYIVADMPKGTGDFGIYGGGTSITIKGEEYVRFTVKVPAGEIAQMVSGIGHASVIFWFDAAKTPDKSKAFFRALIDDKEYSVKQVDIKILPKLVNGPRPKKFRNFVCWGTFSNQYVPKSLYPAVYKLMRSMGLSNILIRNTVNTNWTKYFVDNLKREGGVLWANVPHTPFVHSGETKIINEGTEYFAKISGDYYQKMKSFVDGVFWDYEPPNAVQNPQWDNKATKIAFAKKYGFDVNTLTKKRLQGELRQKWLAFRTWQIGQVLRLWAEYVHSINPNWEIAVSQGSGFPLERHVDYKVYTDIPHLINLPQIYLKAPFGYANNVDRLRRYLPKTKWFPVITSYMVADKGWPAKVSPKVIYSHYVSSAMLGCVGCSFWPDVQRGMDMEYIWEISRAVRDIAVMEKYIFDGKLFKGVDIQYLTKGIDWNKNSLYRTYRLNNKILVAFNNMHQSKSAEIKVGLKNISGGSWRVYDAVTNKSIVSPNKTVWNSSELAKGFVYKVPAATVGMIIIAKK